MINKYENNINSSPNDYIIEIYKNVLDGNLNSFPRGFWKSHLGKSNSIICLKWLIEERLKIPMEEIPRVVTRELLMKNKLGYVLNAYYGCRVYNYIDTIYPNQFAQTEFRRTRRHCI